MELIDYIDGLFIDVPSIPDYWISVRLNKEFKGNASIWYTAMKEIHGRRNWPLWKRQLIQKYSNGTWIWQTTMSFENDKYSVYKDPYEWCLRKSKRLKVIDPQMNIQIRNHKLLKHIPGELEHAVNFRCNNDCTLCEIANALQNVGKTTNIGKYTPYKSRSFKDKQPFRVEFEDKPRERVAEVERRKILVTPVVQQTTMPTAFQRQTKKSMLLRKSQRRNCQQSLLNQTLCVMPSEHILIMTKTQEKNY
ncbi:hypothetical protein O181_037639 [Austropuccinia psidii MF-1]|uniref:Uncharacterized protein n=1 Tax=Austropuccinia psidii MF-1 TaxID=1389203 RepID=A0A9Q3D6X8_9BASI|nr:hypothetical protein [Austropuccinia psidii MF-1]